MTEHASLERDEYGDILIRVSGVTESEFAVWANLDEGWAAPVRASELARPATPEPPPGFVKPGYWTQLCLYLMPGRARPVINLVGPTGNGKTTAAQVALDVLGYSFYELDMNEFVEPAELVGGTTFTIKGGDGQEEFKPGIVARAFSEGKALILNEYDASDPRKVMCLQSAFQDKGRDGKRRYVTTPEGVVYPIGDCPIILTSNTFGDGATRQYVGRNALDTAQLDRMSVISTYYENEIAIIEAHGYSTSTARKVVGWAMPLRKRIDDNMLRVSLSNRTLLRMAEALEFYGWNLTQAAEREFFGRLDSMSVEALR